MPYLKDEKEKIQRFTNGFPLSSKDHIDFNEPLSLEESIKKLNNFYEQSKRKPELKCD